MDKNFLTVLMRMRNENLFLESFIKHYFAEGVDEIHILDDNSTQPFPDIVKDPRVMTEYAKKMGFRIEFANSAGQTIGDDTSGNGNDFTVNNMAATDITTDSPTQNHATFDPFFSSSTMRLTQGNLTVTDNGGTAWETAFVGIPVQSGKWYFEATVDVAGLYDTFFGVNPLDTIATNNEIKAT